jgi:hypothetical protein
VVRVVGIELVVEGLPARAGYEVQPVQRHVAHDLRAPVQPGREPEGFEQVQPLLAPGALMVAHHGIEGNVGRS